MNRSGRFFLLAALAGPAFAGSPPSPPQAGPARVAADLVPLIEAHRALTAGSSVLPLWLAPAPRPRSCDPLPNADATPGSEAALNRSADARCTRVQG